MFCKYSRCPRLHDSQGYSQLFRWLTAGDEGFQNLPTRGGRRSMRQSSRCQAKSANVFVNDYFGLQLSSLEGTICDVAKVKFAEIWEEEWKRFIREIKKSNIHLTKMELCFFMNGTTSCMHIPVHFAWTINATQSASRVRHPHQHLFAHLQSFSKSISAYTTSSTFIIFAALGLFFYLL